MKIFNSGINTHWVGKNFLIDKSKIILRSLSHIEHEVSIPKSDKITITLIAKRRTGSGFYQ